MSNLLDKASIILTPTAYKNSRVMCVKPSDASGDFTFSRNSAATRVNAQGLVENVQILSSNLVQNPSFSEEGVQEVSNGSFTNGSTDWTLGTGWSIGEDKAVATNSASGQKLRQAGQLAASKTYKLVYEVTEITLGGFLPIVGAVAGTAVYSIGTYTEYITTINDDFYIRTLGTTSGSITNISVKEVGQNWEFFGEAELTSQGARIYSSAGSYSALNQNNVLTIGNQYKVTFDVISTNGTNLANGDGTTTYDTSTTGNKTFYIIASETEFQLKRITAPSDVTVTNIKIIEITTDTNLPRINYEGFSYQDALGSEEIVNGGFDSDTAWIKSPSGVTISGGAANFTSGQDTYIFQSPMVIGKKYLISLDYDINSLTGSGYFGSNVGSGDSILSMNGLTGTGTLSGVITASAIELIVRSSTFNGSIDNVSVKEYSGQEVVPDSGCGSWLFESQSTNLIPYSEDFSDSSWLKRTSDATQIPIITSNYATSPDGTQNASRVVITKPSTDNDYANVSNISTVTKSIGDKFTNSIYVKADESSQVGKEINLYAWDGSYLTMLTYALTDSWVRIDAVHTITTVTGNMETLSVGKGRSSAGGVSLANMATDFLISFAQFEQQSYATSYIPTSGSSVTRNQDVCTNGGSLASINSTEGVLYAEIAINQNDNGSFRLISITDTTDTIRIGFGKKDLDAKWYIKLLIGSLDITSDTINFQEGFQKIAIRYKSGDIGVYINGTKVITDTSNYVNTLSFDNVSFDWNFNNFPFFGKTKALAVWKEALSDAELADLTYPTPTFPTFTLDFNTIAEQFTFARGSEATYVDAQGLIQSTASNNAPRLDYSTGAEAFLLEPQSTQLVTYSEDFSDASWNKNAVTLESGYLAPDGTNNAFKVSGGSGIMSSTPPTSQTTTRSIFARTVSGTGTAQLLSHNSNTNNIFTITEQWKRFEVNSANITGFNNFYAVDFRGSSSLSEIILWGANATNDQDYATSYIPSNGSQTTRNQETCNNATPEINSEEGTLYAEIAALSNDGTNRYLSISDGSFTNRVSILYSSVSNTIGARLVVGGSSIFLNSTGQTQDNNNKIAITWKINDYKLYINGIQVAAYVSGGTFPASTLSEISYNDGGTGVAYMYGNTKDLQVYPKALSDAELIKLTTI